MPTWRPDTCGCVLNVAEDWDSAVPVQKCQSHADVPDADLFHTVYRTENRPKNELCAFVAHLMPGIASDQGKPYGLPAEPSFCEDRKIHLELPVDAEDKDIIQTWADHEYGEGKVVVE